MSIGQEEITLPVKLISPGSLDEDDVVLSFLKEPNEEAKYRSKLSSLYSNEPLHM